MIFISFLSWRCYYDDSFAHFNINNDMYFISNLKQPDQVQLHETLLENSVDQFNPTDTELLRMLTTEEECTAILQNIAASELINTGTHYEESLGPSMNEVSKKESNSNVANFKWEYVAYCKDCGLGFVRKNLYNNHRRIHHDGEKFICDICGCSLATSSGLKEHKLTHGENYGKERLHICETCGQSYLTSRNLNSHMKIHKRIKKYVCSICGKSVSSKKILETHIKMHTGLKDYLCSICNSVFASSEYLKIHQRIHSVNKPYQCQSCGKSFTQKTSLTVHIRTHTGQKPYKCECGKNFTTKSHLMTHYKTHDVGGVDLDYISNIEKLK
ncbi:hypothetical protein HHI36_018435 [Cryptolaemus montrouzieri]|uniref:C2H2-type domain-containing protein n=1 Tax=Cryptolaemus montrouzieri TaxID=559131 RepID=A0ABD2P0U0_9CUCU